MISTVDTEARHGHKSKNRHFDGYKAHLSIDPDSELIDEVVATPANTHDHDAVAELLAGPRRRGGQAEILGDSAYADGATRQALGEAGFTLMAKCPPIRNATGGFTKDRFVVDLETQHRHLPGRTARRDHPTRDGGGRATFKLHCDCPLRRACTTSRCRPHDHDRRPRGDPPTGPSRAGDARVAGALSSEPPPRRAQDRPLRPPRLGRANARTRGRRRISTDLDTRAGALNWARLALGLGPRRWPMERGSRIGP